MATVSELDGLNLIIPLIGILLLVGGYYTKIAPRQLPLKSVYQYEILYSRSSDGAVSHDGITWTQRGGA